MDEQNEIEPGVKAYFDAKDRAYEAITKLGPQQTFNLMQKLFGGIFDVGFEEAPTAEGLAGVTLYLEDLVAQADILDLSEGSELGQYQ
jgi:hypothetical protein